MRLVVLGKSPAWQDAGGACSGYLVEHEDTRVLLDCGSGVFAKLREYCDPRSVDAVVISHLHADHFFDLFTYAYGLTLAPESDGVQDNEKPGGGKQPILYGPPASSDKWAALCDVLEMPNPLDQAFAVHEYAPGEVLQVGSLELRFCEVPHYITTYAIDVRSLTDDERLTYGADHRPTDALTEFAQGTDLLLIEATLSEPEHTAERGHLTAAEAGEHGQKARAKRLVLTHISDQLNPQRALQAANSHFDGPVEIAREGAIYSLGQ